MVSHNHASTLELRAIESLKTNPRNARTHSKNQIKAIAESIREFGFTQPVLIDDDGMILAGHGRFAAAKLLGLDSVPAIRVTDLNDGQKRALVLADNKLAERAGWDREALTIELDELSVALPELGLSLDLTGFEAGEIDTILADAEEEKAASPDDDIEPPKDPVVTRPGDLWQLGRHRILCGDARDPEKVKELMAEDKADMVFTDPPFNVPIRGHVLGHGKVMHPEFAMASGEMTEEEFIEFLRVTLQNAADVSKDGALHFVFQDWRHIGALLHAGKSVYRELKNIIVWSKTNGGQGGLYRSQHELIALFKVGSSEHVNNVQLGRFGKNRSNVWTYAGINAFKADRAEELASHPTVKPVAMIADAIKDVTRRNAIIMDPFAGSGSTAIAAERTGRRARLIEIEPRYVDVTIRRFERVTKSDAIHAATGMTFTELAASRGNEG